MFFLSDWTSPVDLQILVDVKGLMPEKDQIWQHATQENVWRPPAK